MRYDSRNRTYVGCYYFRRLEIRCFLTRIRLKFTNAKDAFGSTRTWKIRDSLGNEVSTGVITKASDVYAMMDPVFKSGQRWYIHYDNQWQFRYNRNTKFHIQIPFYRETWTWRHTCYKLQHTYISTTTRATTFSSCSLIIVSESVYRLRLRYSLTTFGNVEYLSQSYRNIYKYSFFYKRNRCNSNFFVINRK